jgi:predicted nucleic acid-binding protein
MLVVDASAVGDWLLGRPSGESIAHHFRAHEFDLHAPHLLDVEVLSALRSAVSAGYASPERAAEAVGDLSDLPAQRYGHEPLISRIWELRQNFSAYDATYVALAEAIAEDGAPLLTADARLARAAGAHTDVRVLLAG